MKYKLLTEHVIDSTTGEISTKDFKEIVTKSNLKRGFRMVYALYDEAQLYIVKGEKDLAVMLHIRNLFTKNKVEIPLNARKIAKEIVIKKENKIEKGIGVSKVSTVIRRMVEVDLLMRIERGVYRLNPFAYLPYQSEGALLQKEWLELKEVKKVDI
jgi:hypothetical protein